MNSDKLLNTVYHNDLIKGYLIWFTLFDWSNSLVLTNHTSQKIFLKMNRCHWTTSIFETIGLTTDIDFYIYRFHHPTECLVLENSVIVNVHMLRDKFISDRIISKMVKRL